MTLHWSIPRASELKERGKCDLSKNQGSLFVEFLVPRANDVVERDLSDSFRRYGSIRYIAEPKNK